MARTEFYKMIIRLFQRFMHCSSAKSQWLCYTLKLLEPSFVEFCAEKTMLQNPDLKALDSAECHTV